VKHFNIKDSIEFDNFKCVGIVLDWQFYDDLKSEPKKLLSFIQEFEEEEAVIEILDGLDDGEVYQYISNPIMYQLLIGNKKGWISYPELESVLNGKSI